jgi:sarcosine oxidase gamma subunit
LNKLSRSSREIGKYFLLGEEMRFSQKLYVASMVLVFMGLFVPATRAQLNSNIGTVTINASLPESLTVNVTSGTTVNFTLAANTAANAGSTTSSVTTAWTLKPGRTSVAVWAYFSSAAVALLHQTSGNTTDLPSSAVKIQVGGAGPFNALTAVSPFNAAASGLQIGTTAITGLNKTSSRTDTLAYQIDTTVVPQLQADTYIGTLNIEAQATP